MEHFDVATHMHMLFCLFVCLIVCLFVCLFVCQVGQCIQVGNRLRESMVNRRIKRYIFNESDTDSTLVKRRDYYHQ